jgi:hypothetical protein
MLEEYQGALEDFDKANVLQLNNVINLRYEKAWRCQKVIGGLSSSLGGP